MKIVFFGTPEFAVESLRKLLEDGRHEIVAVVTMPDKIAGRGHKLLQSDVKKFAVERGLNVLQPANLKSPEFLETLKSLDADLFIVIAFRMLPQSVWQLPPLGTFNLHASLLPKYRGAAPINRAVMAGETETGITTFFLKHEIDTGDIIRQQRIEISDADDAGTVHDRLMALGAEMVVDTVNRIADGSVTTCAQPEGEYIAAPKIFREDCNINWNMPAIKIHNMIRGLSPYPGAYTRVVDNGGKFGELKIYSSKLTDIASTNKAGTIEIREGRLLVATGDFMLQIESLQPSGKRRMTATEYLRGYKPKAFLNYDND